MTLNMLTNLWNAATHRRHLSRPRHSPSRRCKFEPLERRELLSLTAVPANCGYPWSSIAEIRITFPDRQVYVGSAEMIDSYHALTAGHCVYSAKDGGWASSIIVTPELHGASAPFGQAYVINECTYLNFRRIPDGL
jgi:hypothetical protein